MPSRPNVEHHYGAFIVGRELVQCDYDYPRAAERCGWDLRRVQRDRIYQRRPRSKSACEHSSTDGTVDCRECGVTASRFIRAAGDFLSSIAMLRESPEPNVMVKCPTCLGTGAAFAYDPGADQEAPCKTCGLIGKVTRTACDMRKSRSMTRSVKTYNA